MFIRTFYVRISANRIRIDSPGISQCFDDSAVVAILADKAGIERIAAIGKQAEIMYGQPGVRIGRPFYHPRLATHDPLVASKLMQFAVREVMKAIPWYQATPLVKIIMHPQFDFEGGLTATEFSAFSDLAASCGARLIYFLSGPELSPNEIQNHAFQKAVKALPSIRPNVR